ncbi:MAG: hypothetical protein QF707_08780, partial [Candidatus Poseidoniaceae archaeon]|nr:hypothetical protein [Candidatus Poseidoniaceae archaeon]
SQSFLIWFQIYSIRSHIVQRPSTTGVRLQGGVGVPILTHPAQEPATCNCGLVDERENADSQRLSHV